MIVGLKRRLGPAVHCREREEHQRARAEIHSSTSLLNLSGFVNEITPTTYPLNTLTLSWKVGECKSLPASRA